jgi:predicted TPR repeat methyltransferase
MASHNNISNNSVDTISTSHNINNLEGFYADWSNTYDKDVSNCNYVGPETIVNILTKKFKIHGSKIIDIGCGNGLLSEYLDKFKYQIDIDGLDFSNEMLDVSRQRNYYTNLFQKDVYTITTDTEYMYDYGISVGMFTHNHVEPRAIKNILHYIVEEGVFVFTVRESYCKEKDFSNYIASLKQENTITNFEIHDSMKYIDDENCHIYILYK